VIPLFLLASIYVGQNVQYWGLERNIPRPSVAWELDQNCNRMSELHQPCLYSAAVSNRTILLIGDSHAAHISQAVIDAAKIENLNAAVWTLSSCHVRFIRTVSDQISDICWRQNQEILAWVKRNKPSAIIVSQFVRSESPQNDLRNALDTLHSIVPEILLIENTPVFPDGKDFMVSRPLVMSPYEPPESFLLTEMESSDKYSSNQLATWGRTNGILTMDFTPLFCSEKICSRFSNGLWLYRDSVHLSVDGAELAIPQIENFLKRF
jgi:hypothetical protein